MFVVDTNILLYAADRRGREHERARYVLETWRNGTEAFYATWPIFYEFLRVATHPTVWRQPLSIAEGWEFLSSLITVGHFGLLIETDLHSQVLERLTQEYPKLAGSILHDFHTAVLMEEHGISEIRSADTDFHQFRFLRVVNPLA